MKILPVGAELFHANGRTNGRTDGRTDGLEEIGRQTDGKTWRS